MTPNISSSKAPEPVHSKRKAEEIASCSKKPCHSTEDTNKRTPAESDSEDTSRPSSPSFESYYSPVESVYDYQGYETAECRDSTDFVFTEGDDDSDASTEPVFEVEYEVDSDPDNPPNDNNHSDSEYEAKTGATEPIAILLTSPDLYESDHECWADSSDSDDSDSSQTSAECVVSRLEVRVRRDRPKRRRCRKRRRTRNQLRRTSSHGRVYPRAANPSPVRKFSRSFSEPAGVLAGSSTTQSSSRCESPTSQDTERDTDSGVSSGLPSSLESNLDVESSLARSVRECLMCIMCRSQLRDAAFVHGKFLHQLCCYPCAERVYREDGRCPECRITIQKVVRSKMCAELHSVLNVR